MSKFKLKQQVMLLALAVTSFTAYADNQGYKTITMQCPPSLALKHDAPGQPWYFDAEYKNNGWYIVQDPDAINSTLTSFKERTGGIETIFNDRHYDAPMQATCHYESGGDIDLYVKSKHTYNPASVIENAGKYPERYTAPQNNVTVCSTGFYNFPTDPNPNALEQCAFKAYMFSDANKKAS